MPPEPAGSDWPGRAPGVTAGPRETSPDGSDNVHPEQITTRVRAANAERANRWGTLRLAERSWGEESDSVASLAQRLIAISVPSACRHRP